MKLYRLNLALATAICLQAQVPAIFPSRAVTNADMLIRPNNCNGTLVDQMGSTDTSFMVSLAYNPTNPVSCPSGNFLVQINDGSGEQISISGFSGNTFTVASRGFNGTTATVHYPGVTWSSPDSSYFRNRDAAEIESVESYILTHGGGGGGAFNQIATGTNTTATMTCGTGCTMTTSGSGVINASAFSGSVILSQLPGSGALTINGTTDQIAGCGSVSLGGTCVLSTPQNIDSTANPTFASLTVSNSIQAGSSGTIGCVLLGDQTSPTPNVLSVCSAASGYTGTLNMPSAAATAAGQILANDGSGNTSWYSGATFTSSVVTINEPLSVNPGVNGGAAPPKFLLSEASNSTNFASTGPMFLVNTANTYKWASGTYAGENFSNFSNPTMSGATFTSMNTVNIGGPIIAASGATITRDTGLFVDTVAVGGSGLGTVTSAYAALFQAPTGATNNYALALQSGGASPSTVFTVDGSGDLSTSGTITFSNLGGVFTGNYCVLTSNAGLLSSGACTVPISEVTSSGTSQVSWLWDFTAGTGAVNGLSLGESSASTFSGGGNILNVSTATGSTLNPIVISNSLNSAQTLAALTVSPTWNTTGVVDAALLVNVTNTASGANSKLLDLQVGSSSLASVDKGGYFKATYYTATGGAPTCTINSSYYTSSSCSILSGSTDQSGVVSITTGTGSAPSGGTTIATINFTATHAIAPQVVQVQMVGVPLSVTTIPYVSAACEPSTTSWCLVGNSTALSTSTTYRISYEVQ